MQTLYNTLTRKKEIFVPIEPGKVRMYVCGVTVYDFFHIGNARTLTVFDMIYRWLQATGFNVTYVRNITDVDDKIIERANKNGEPIDALTERMVAAMHEDTDRLNLLRPTYEPRATYHIDSMLEIIKLLEKKGIGYRSPSGDVYYSVRQFADYGKLSRKSLDDLRSGERVAIDNDKRNPLDFVLWKAAKPNEPHWPSIFGEGRPGWHIECSAMCRAMLGKRLDIHGGGWDLQFPHHENEIAQSEGAWGEPFVNYWMHTAFLNMDSEKMSKSLGNFFTAREILGKLNRIRGGEELRYFLLRGHYRSEINYTWDTLMDAGNSLIGLYRVLKDVSPATISVDWANPFAARFKAAMEDDFDTPIAFSVLHELRDEVRKTGSSVLSGLLKALGETIGLLQIDPVLYVGGESQGASSDVEKLIAERAAAKKIRNFVRADEIRKELEGVGIILEDRPDGLTEWRCK